MTSIVEPRRGILLVSSIKHQNYLVELLEEHALREWKTSPLIKLLPLPQHLFRDLPYVKGQIKNAVQNAGTYFDVYVFGIECPVEHLSDFSGRERWDVRFCGTIQNTFQEKLKRGLRALQLDWFSAIAATVSNAWLRAMIDEEHIKKWIKQFESLGEHQWIGKKLLQSLDFWPEAKVINALRITPEELKGFKHICLSTEKGGKSADILRNLVSKRLASFQGHDCNVTISAANECIDIVSASNILWIEDSLLTATEVSSLINSLLGKIKEGHKPKTSPLSNPANINNKNIQFRFAIATDFGYGVLCRVMEENKLVNCEITYGEFVEIMTSSGNEAFINNNFYADVEQKIIKDPPLFFNMPAFANSNIWKNDRRDEAINFCKKIGKQLFSSYLQNKIEQDGWSEWSQRRVSQSALGMNGFGLALALAHTVPKASLPLFWGSGEVSIKVGQTKRKVNWEPLFPDAD